MPTNNNELGVDPEALWQAADKLRGSIDAAEYKHVVLGLIFLKYISDAFEARRAKLKEELQRTASRARRPSLCWKSATNTPPRACSGCRRRRAGNRSRRRARRPTSAS